jgi:hypothetical protein
VVKEGGPCRTCEGSELHGFRRNENPEEGSA